MRRNDGQNVAHTQVDQMFTFREQAIYYHTILTVQGQSPSLIIITCQPQCRNVSTTLGLLMTALNAHSLGQERRKEKPRVQQQFIKQ